MREPEEDELVLRLTAEHLVASGEWPELRGIHRRIFREFKLDIDVREVARRLAPHPFLSGYHDLGDTFAPPLHVLARTSASDPLIDAVLKFITFALDKYLSSSEETQVTEAEFTDGTQVPGDVSKVLRELVSGVPFLTHGGGSGPAGWYVTISDDVVRWSGVTTRDQLLQRLEEIEEEKWSQYAAMAQAKARLVSEKESVAPLEEREVALGPVRMQPTHYYESVALRLGGGASQLSSDVAFPPRRSGMPDLSHLYSKNILPLILNITLRAQVGTTHPSLAYTAAYVRLVDKAVREYEFARRSLEEFVATSSEHLSPYLRAADHLENCLNSARRAIRYARRIRRDREALQVAKSELPTQDDEDLVAAFRNASEHADEQVATGTLAEGDAMILMLHETHFALGNVEASYGWLAKLLTRLHALSSRVAGVASRA